MGFITWIIFGLLAGAIAKAIMPGKQGGGWLITIILGIVGAFVGGLIGVCITLGRHWFFLELEKLGTCHWRRINRNLDLRNAYQKTSLIYYRFKKQNPATEIQLRDFYETI